MYNLFTYRLLMAIGQLMLLLVNHWWSFWPAVTWQLGLLCGFYLITVLLLQQYKPDDHNNRYMLVIDLILWSCYFSFLGGISNPLIWCLLIPSLLSTLSHSVQFTWLLTIFANLLYAGLWALGINDNSHGAHIHGNMMQQHVLGMWLGFMAVSTLLTWVTTNLMRRISEKNAALMKAEKRIQADDNLIKMATLVTSLAHELGTPLNSIQLLVDELKITATEQQQTSDLKLLESQVMRCKTALKDMTDVTNQTHKDQLKVMQITQFIDQLIAAVEPQNCQITQSGSNQKNTFLAVDTLLHLACVNVLNNSLSAGAKHINVRIEDGPTNITLTINDDGAGTEHVNSVGLGIGLKLSTRIIESMAGEIRFSATKNGAKTTIQLPKVKNS